MLSLVECKACAERLHIQGEVFSAALHHLIHHNVFLYYPEVLPQAVFCDPQVVLTKVSELVERHHGLKEDPDSSVAADGNYVAFRDRGIISVELLREFSSHYIVGLFTPQDLAKLFVHLHVAAEIGRGKYLMPALLPHLNSTQVSKYLQQTVSLVIRPTQGYTPNGLFCCLVAHLLSPSNPSPWRLCMEKDRPLCMYRNCMLFEQKSTTDIITLVDMFSYIKVHIRSINISSNICRRVKDCVHSTIKEACNSLKYNDINFEDAFVCTGDRCASELSHLAEVVCTESSGGHTVYRWKCTILPTQCGELSQDQLIWWCDENDRSEKLHENASRKQRYAEYDTNEELDERVISKQKYEAVSHENANRKHRYEFDEELHENAKKKKKGDLIIQLNSKDNDSANIIKYVACDGCDGGKEWHEGANEEIAQEISKDNGSANRKKTYEEITLQKYKGNETRVGDNKKQSHAESDGGVVSANKKQSHAESDGGVVSANKKQSHAESDGGVVSANKKKVTIGYTI